MKSLKDITMNIEKEAIIIAFKECNWTIAKAGRILGITPRQIGYKMKKYEITPSQTV